VALIVLFVPKIYLSFMGKAELMKRLQAETQQLYQEIWARDRQISDLKTGTGAGTTSGGSDE
jgi:hypothetical protein